MEKNIGKILQKRIAKTNRKEPKVEKVIKWKNDKLYVKRNETIIHLIVG